MTSIELLGALFPYRLMQLSSNVLIILNFARRQFVKLPESMTSLSSILVSFFASLALQAHAFAFSVSLSMVPQEEDILFVLFLNEIFYV